MWNVTELPILMSWVRPDQEILKFMMLLIWWSVRSLVENVPYMLSIEPGLVVGEPITLLAHPQLLLSKFSIVLNFWEQNSA